MEIKAYKKSWNKGAFPGIDDWRESRPDRACFRGLAGSSDSFLAAEIFESTQSTVLVLVPEGKRVDVVAEECGMLVGEDRVTTFPSRDAIPYNMKSPFGPVVESRFACLSDLMSGRERVVVAPAAVLLQRVLPSKTLFNRVIRLHVGQEIEMGTLAGWLTENGFRRETTVENLGTFAIRGGVFDIYPFMMENPIRLEFWGDTIESIRRFDIFTQKSRRSIEDAEIFPMGEFALSDEAINEALQTMREYSEEQGIDPTGINNLEHSWKQLHDREGIEWFYHWFALPKATLLDYLPSSTTIMWDDILQINHRMEAVEENYYRHLSRVPDAYRDLVSRPEQLLASQDEILEDLSIFPIVFAGTLDPGEVEKEYRAEMIDQPSFPTSTIDPLINDLSDKAGRGIAVDILCPNLGRAERLTDLVGERCPEVSIHIGYLECGFVDTLHNRAVYTETRIFNRSERPMRFKRSGAGTPITGFDALNPGDYVVHVDRGIGKFVGVERIKTGRTSKDCMALQFSGGKLYVPVEDFSKVQKYVGKDSFHPALSKLGSPAWERTKQKTKESLREMAQELIELYAKRQYFEGIQFPKDSNWQKEFEESFAYDETPDQDQAIRDLKKDMEAHTPMDRLVCGDVGFGKTEVAMRAAAKAVFSGYQVAVLAPTTILVAQHRATFAERMANFPVKIGMLSRFLSAKEQRETVAKLKTGEIDIVIGTHRVLSKDVQFKNLGLLVVDEEQRFGVKHKEKLVEYRSHVDVLSMTATPIPRTLHMSLIGARDLSIINTPPRNRLPIETRVMEQHDQVLRDALENELDRGGQVYIVNNRISKLEQLRDKIEMLVPRARVITAHGQMDEKELELKMREFIAGRFDVLISTVIIENGLDISNVNTIVVTRADMLGLSQLYQLRGRVGRSAEQAYAFLLTPPFRKVSELSLKRLRALEQYTDLGSGFQIAMRDLEIRGAGNILGTRQHGFISQIGFELYCKLLKEAVNEIKGLPPEPEDTGPVLDLPLDAYIPSEYVSESSARVTVYQELSAARTEDEIKQVREGLVDRFGPLPKPVNALVLSMGVRAIARTLGASRVSLNSEEGILGVQFDGGKEKEIAEQMKSVIASAGDREVEVAYEKPFSIRILLTDAPVLDRVMEARSILLNAVEKKSPIAV